MSEYREQGSETECIVYVLYAHGVHRVEEAMPVDLDHTRQSAWPGYTLPACQVTLWRGF